MFDVLILVCVIGVAPPDCQRNTAIDVIRGPSASNEITCGRDGQAFLAGTALARNLDGAYVKIQCTRTASEQRQVEISRSIHRSISTPPP